MLVEYSEVEELEALKALVAHKQAVVDVQQLQQQLQAEHEATEQRRAPNPQHCATTAASRTYPTHFNPGTPPVNRNDAGGSLASLVLELGAVDDAMREQALELLIEMVECAAGADGALLGRGLREVGGISQLCKLAADDDRRPIRRLAWLVLGNLCSDTVDPDAAATKRKLMACSVLPPIAASLSDDDRTVP